jgi:outer membrane protein OmpA-like peptidoglycan-associated protein
MMCKTQKSGATNTVPRRTGGTVGPQRARDGAGNRHRANALALPGVLQAKLSIGKANDPFEQEADRVASEVMRMSNEPNAASVQHGVSPSIQRQCACGGACDKCKKKQMSLKRVSASSHASAEVPSSVDAVLRTAGEPLDAATRSFMEPRFGYDFSQVRVHTDSDAAQSARDVGALAFTVSNHIAFAGGQYAPGSVGGNRLLAHELAHVVQQGGAGSVNGSPVSGVIQRAGDPAAIPTAFACPTDLTTGRPAGTDVPFETNKSAITTLQRPTINTFFILWVASGSTDQILVHGYASETGDQGPNWTLSCQRAQAVRDALVGLGVPRANIDIVAHGESTDFGAAASDNEHAVISTSRGSLFHPPLVFGTLTPLDDFASRSHRRFGVDELIMLDFTSLPPTPAADFGGLQWHLASGGGTLSSVTVNGSAVYTAPGTAQAVTLELRVVAGATAGRVVSTHAITIVEPNAVRMVAVPGSFPNFGGWGNPPIPTGTWGAGMQADVFIRPADVSFQGVEFGEGTTTGVVTGSFLSGRSGIVHPASHFGPGGGGNATTGTPLAPAQDGIWTWGGVTPGSFMGIPTCGVSTFLWAIPWLFTVTGGAATPFAGGFTANHRVVSSLFCTATIDKAGAGPFCRRINGTTC